MKKRISIMIMTVLMGVLLCACGSKTFQCDLCGRTVTGKVNEFSILGQKIEICNSCYKYIK